MRGKEILAPMPRRKELHETPNRLCNEISRLFRSRMREGMMPEDGVMSQPGAKHVLATLAVSDGITQLDIVKQTNLRAPTVSVILKKMEEQGLVDRKTNPKDMREVHVFLTEKGRSLDDRTIAQIKKIDAIALDGISDEENEILMRLLKKIRDNLIEDYTYVKETK